MTVNDQMNAWIRGEVGRVIVTSDAAPGQDQAPRRADANAGNGATAPGIGRGLVDMNTFIRQSRNRSWTTNG